MRLIPSHSSRFQPVILFLLDEPENRSIYICKFGQVHIHATAAAKKEPIGMVRNIQ
jgi:hypothetical protein